MKCARLSLPREGANNDRNDHNGLGSGVTHESGVLSKLVNRLGQADEHRRSIAKAAQQETSSCVGISDLFLSTDFGAPVVRITGT